VAAVLAKGLTGFGRVTFPASGCLASGPIWEAHGADRHAWLSAPWGTSKVARKLFGDGPIELPLVSTAGQEAVARLFDDSGFPWWHRAQFALLSSGDGPPDLADRWTSLALLLTPRWAEALAGLRSAGILAVARPGVDGDVVGFACASPEARDGLRRSLFEAAAAAGLTTHEGDSRSFADGIAGGRAE
jgi:hypothetical protein